MKIIDAHNHPDWHNHDLDRFLKNMDENGITQTWLLNWETMESDYHTIYNQVTTGKLFSKQSGGSIFAFDYFSWWEIHRYCDVSGIQP